MNNESAADAKQETLLALLHEMESVLVAYSGGADSAFLAAMAHRALGPRALMATAVSPSLPAEEREAAAALARRNGWRHRFVATDEFANEAFVANPPNRCYYCKHELFRCLRAAADAENLHWVADGSNMDDLRDYRPGARAGREWRVRSPLQEAEYTKSDIRAAARRLGLETADKPASACLASRVPYGTRLDHQTLQRIEQAEHNLRTLGFGQLRVRAHGDIARIELDAAALNQTGDPQLRARLADAVKSTGFGYATLDLDGYRTGSMNERLATATVQQDTGISATDGKEGARV